MKKICLILFILVINYFYGFSESPHLDITYTGNEGFLISSENKKVLIDALFQSNYPNFLAPTETMIQQIINGESPYDNIDLLLVTHRHGDHFDPGLAIQFLENQSGSKLIAHQQAVEKMKDLPGFDKISNQIIEINSDWGTHSTMKEKGIIVDIFCMKHSPYMRDGLNIHEQIRNLAFIVNLDGTRFYHSGDATIKDNINVFGEYKFSSKPVDVMLLQGYDIYSETKQFITKNIKPDKIIGMHVSPDELDNNMLVFQTHYPNGKIFREQGQTFHFKNRVNYHTLSGPYLGQKPPKSDAEVFAPDIISSENLEHSAPAFSPDGNEMYWSVIRQSNDSVFQDNMYMKIQDGKWTEPQLVPFCSGKFYEGGPVISTDGKKLYIYRGDAVPSGGSDRPINIVCYTKTENGWENPDIIAEGVFHSVADNGNIYITKGQSIARIKFENNKYSEPEILGQIINKPDFQNWTPYIAPDESYMIFSRLDFNGDYGELMISFYDKENDVWNEPLNLGSKVNSGNQERFPSVSNDGKFLFFTRPHEGYSQDIWWVKTEMIQELKTKISK